MLETPIAVRTTGRTHPASRSVHVLPEGGHDSPGIAPVVTEPRCQVEQVSAPRALVERPQQLRQQPVEFEGIVERRAAPEGQRLGERGFGELGAAVDEFLLDLEILYPRCRCSPLGDVVSRDHGSVSMSAFTYNRQSRLRDAFSAVADGRSFAKLRARFRTCALRNSALTPPKGAFSRVGTSVLISLCLLG